MLVYYPFATTWSYQVSVAGFDSPCSRRRFKTVAAPGNRYSPSRRVKVTIRDPMRHK